jgi:hypothetical protein
LIAEETQEESQAIDPVFKQIVEEEFAAYNAACQTEYEVGRLPRTIDAFVTVEDEEERQKIQTETPFFYLLKHSQLEFKGRGDRLTKSGYVKIRGRMEFLLSGKQVSPATMTVTIISAGKPRTVFTYARKEREQPFVATTEKGYYKTKGKPPIYLIVINELPIVPKNYPLLVFASSQQKFRNFLQQMITEGNRTYIRYAYEVRPQVTKEVLTMAGISSRLSRKDLEFMAEDIGRDLVAVMDPKDVMQAMEPQDVLEGMDGEKQRQLLALFSPEERLADMSAEELLKGISPETQKALLDFLLKSNAVPTPAEEQSNGNSNH